MVEIVGIKFTNAGKMYYFSPDGLNLKAGTQVLVETARGVEMGHVVTENKLVDEAEIVAPLKPIIREVTEEDLKYSKESKELEKEAFDIAVEKINEHNLDMKLVDAEYTFDRSKLTFFFTADGRVDFRELVKSLAGVFKTRIELRQIGVRDEARQIGSLGICGRSLCCSTFLNDFQPVSIKMAKEQGLSLNPTKISGVCGRLMCCLQYEQNAYDYMLCKMPKKGDKVETPDGPGIVADTATLKGQVKVKFADENGENFKFETYELDKTKLNKGGKIDLVPVGTTQEEEPVVVEKETEIIEEKPVEVKVFEKKEEPVVDDVTDAPQEEEPKKTEKKPFNKNRRARYRNNRNRQKNKDNKKEDNNSGGYSNGYSQ